MHNSAALLDIHASTHTGLARLMQHCSALTPEELGRSLPGFSFPSILEQFDHIIGAEEYWVSVLQGKWDTEGSMPAVQTLDSLSEYRVRVEEATAKYLAGLSDEFLNADVELGVWPEGQLRPLVPAMVLLRTLTHSFQHRGQVIAMCRLLGHPAPSSDYPVMRSTTPA